MKQENKQKLLNPSALSDLKAYLSGKLPRLEMPKTRKEWEARAARVRKEMLALFFRGHPPGLLELPPKVKWKGVLDEQKDYRIKKLVYEGYPGMWIPALLYEPRTLRGKTPVVLNPNGHHTGGKAMAYKQARCINLAKRGMIALNTEFIGMGELRADWPHNRRISPLDLCGAGGIAVFYLAMKRGLDVLLSHPKADLERVAMTGLSGGGWQTIILSSLDTRVTVLVPVAGHSPVWQRIHYTADLGDLEQIPSDFCTVGDYDVLAGMLSPRPVLFIYNVRDDCCFRAGRTKKSVYEPTKALYERFYNPDNVQFHSNRVPGTHNYDLDNRLQLYRFLNRHFGLDGTDDELPWKREIYTEEELSVGLPADSLTMASLALRALNTAAEERKKKNPVSLSRGGRIPAKKAGTMRKRLSAFLSVPEYPAVREEPVSSGKSRDVAGATVEQLVLHLDGPWRIPVTVYNPTKPGVSAKSINPSNTTVIISDQGRGSVSGLIRGASAQGERVITCDLFSQGELAFPSAYHTVLASTGQRPLGLMVGQLEAVQNWALKKYGIAAVRVVADQRISSVCALIRTALEPEKVLSLTAKGLPITLDNLVRWQLEYEDATPLFCFGFLREFDIPDLIRLSRPVPIDDEVRGPISGPGRKSQDLSAGTAC